MAPNMVFLRYFFLNQLRNCYYLLRQNCSSSFIVIACVSGARDSPRHRRQGHGQPHRPSPVLHHDAEASPAQRARRPHPERLLRSPAGGQEPHRRPGRHRQMQRIHQRHHLETKLGCIVV